MISKRSSRVILLHRGKLDSCLVRNVVRNNSTTSNPQNHQWAGAATAVVLGSSVAIYTNFDSLKEYVFHKDSTNFELMAALEMKDEMQKVRLAQIVHELHELANHDKKGLRKANVQARGTNVQDVNWSKLTPSRAWALVDALQEGGRLDLQTLYHLLPACRELLLTDPTVVDLGFNDNITVVGDLHGSLTCLKQVLKLLGEIGGDSNKVVVFNGDFVDRGTSSLEVICSLLLLKLAYPKHVYLLRGNHEDPCVSNVYGFKDELLAKYGRQDHDTLWDELMNVFTALPICAKTPSFLVLHGGLPWDNFNLTELEALSTKDRCSVRTTMDPKSRSEKLIHGLLWSDPAYKQGIHSNPRGAGVTFGPDVAKRFLERHGLKYLIRSHEVARNGTKFMDCGSGRGVLTVFSSANYPAGQGYNSGAVLHLNANGKYKADMFKYEDSAHTHKGEDLYMDTLRTLIASSKRVLAESFEPYQDEEGLITAKQWSQVMGDELEMLDVPWMALQPTMAPNAANSNKIDWKAFLDSHNVSHACSMDSAALEVLYANHEILLTIFKFLDIDGNGTVDLQEFKTGINLLNKRLPENKKLGNPERLFDALDLDGNGVIDLQEFSEGFSLM